MDKDIFLDILSRHLKGTATLEEEAFIDVYYRLFATDPGVNEVEAMLGIINDLGGS